MNRRRQLAAMFASIDWNEKPTELEYIASNGTQIIDTGILPKTTTKVAINFMIESEGWAYAGKSHQIMGAVDSAENSFVINTTADNDRNLYCWINKTYASEGWGELIHVQNFVFDQMMGLYIQSGSVMSNGTRFTGVTKTADHTENTMCMFGSNRYGRFVYYTAGVLRINSFVIYDGNTIVRSFMPCIYKGRAGMWDKVENKFYGNVGTGEFIQGPKVEA